MSDRKTERIPPEGMRINKYIAHCGVTSRRKADGLVEEGRVRLDGERVSEHGVKVQRGARVEVDGTPISLDPFAYFLLNKDKDTISTTDDPKGRDTVLDLLGVSQDEKEGLFPVGRLDRNTTGALLLTNDGDLAHRLMHPRYEIEKIYFVRTRENVKPHQIDALRRGIELEDGSAAADRAAYAGDTKSEIALSLHEGRNRQVRRMMEALGHDVVHLERIRYAGLTTEGLRRGQWRRLDEREVGALHKLVSL
ncbi:MAG: rRNA pseudouridine synthase [Bacteroidetes bacterium SW_4_67_19]|nr:MAG: rRNA pseudouridine synthase [Bacteroidetes bacterium SW_4_67_19]